MAWAIWLGGHVANHRVLVAPLVAAQTLRVRRHLIRAIDSAAPAEKRLSESNSEGELVQHPDLRRQGRGRLAALSGNEEPAASAHPAPRAV